MSNVIRCISKDGFVIVVAVDSTSIIAEMERIHHTSATASAALGRTLTAAVLMGSLLKNETDSVTLQIKGDGPIGGIIAVCDYDLNVRGECDYPLADLPINPITKKLDVGKLVGTEGQLIVSKDIGMIEPYVGQVPLVSGEIAEDITAYYAYSEQVPTVCSLGVLVDRDLTIKVAGGFLLQLLPGATESEIELIEKNLIAKESISSLINNGLSPKDIAFQIMEGLNPEVLDELESSYSCHCTEQYMRNILISLGQEQQDAAVLEEGYIEIVCGYCQTKYRFTLDQLR
ncbi:MAG: Hsp33 family molecular chaperone HslO [Oscillospiraceae bacterium]|nr:Hsp33 family molecular chaperone HslO [Oscillospiraceae bacterium]